MNKISSQEYAAGEKIIKKAIGEAISRYDFLQQALYVLTPTPDSETHSLGADYSKLYYNPLYVIELYKKSKKKLTEAVAHTALHCLLLHPSLKGEDERLSDCSADLYVSELWESLNGEDNKATGFQIKSRRGIFFEENNIRSAADIYKCGTEDEKKKNRVLNLAKKTAKDDHSIWRRKGERSEQESREQEGGEGIGGQAVGDGSEGDGAYSSTKSTQMPRGEAEWKQILINAAGENKVLYGAMSAMEEQRPQGGRGKSRVSYKEYLRKFAANEMEREDTNNLDLMLYTAGFDLYGDIPLVEFPEHSEEGGVSDIIVAMDTSGSCRGAVAEDFLTQLMKIFEDMSISGRVDIRLVMFDTEIQKEMIIKNRRDADRMFEDFIFCGFGGTDFTCVFDYAKSLQKTSHKKPKAIFFFSDGMGKFPSQKSDIKTVFFIPQWDYYEFCADIPPWVERVIYRDET